MTIEKIMKALGYEKFPMPEIKNISDISLSNYRKIREEFNKNHQPDLKSHILELQFSILKLIKMYNPSFNVEQIEVMKYFIDSLNQYLDKELGGK